MLISQNIKRFRLAKKLTQEQLASSLSVSAQAVSKWETSDTYPDSSLLIPLSKQLGVSLDELFGNDEVSMSDISNRIMRLMMNSDSEDRFKLARDIGWQIERGVFFDPLFDNEQKYDPEELANHNDESYILNDYGFTLISNGKEPFFSVFPESDEGFGNFMKNKEALMEIFAALSDKATMSAITYLYSKNKGYIFEASLLARECEIADEKIPYVINDLQRLRFVSKIELEINGENRTLYHSNPSHKLIALFIIANTIEYRGSYSLQADNRTKPFFK